MTKHEHHSPANVWLMQWQLQHYRIPVWDRVVQRGAASYKLTVLGGLNNGQAIGGESRPYFRSMALRDYSFGKQAFQRWPQAAALLRSERPDVLMMEANPRNFSAWGLPRLCRRLGVASVAWSKVHGYTQISGAQSQFVKRRFFSRFDVAICYGQQSQQELVGYGFDPQRAHVALNTIDTSTVFDQADHFIERGRALKQEAGLAEARILLCVGRLVEAKRQNDLLDAWPSLLQAEPDLALVIVGDGPMLQSIRQRAQAIDPQRIIVTGRVPLGDDYAWAAAADVVAIPGAVGLFLNIAMAFGRPTIIADEYGSDSEILQHLKTGWRYPRSDIQAMSQTIGHVLAGGEQVQRITSQACRFMREHVTIDKMAQAVDSAIRQAIEISRERKAK